MSESLHQKNQLQLDNIERMLRVLTAHHVQCTDQYCKCEFNNDPRFGTYPGTLCARHQEYLGASSPEALLNGAETPPPSSAAGETSYPPREDLKYVVHKRDGTPVDPAARYVVLRIDNPTKPDYLAARAAAVMYVREAWEISPESATTVNKLLQETANA